MNILVTGGLGNIGSWVTDSLVRRGHSVTTFSNRDRVVLCDLDFERQFGDIRDIERLTNVVTSREWDAVIHLASSDGLGSQENAREALLVNTLGTRNLLEVLAARSRDTHLIYFSTFHIYGRSTGLLDEETVCPDPRSDYASTHLFAEYYIRQFHNLSDIPFTIFRLTNAYGAPFEADSTKWSLALNDLARMAYQRQLITLKSNGLGRRDFIWIGDVCDVIEKVLKKGPANRVFNLASGEDFSTIEIANIVREVYLDVSGYDVCIRVNQLDRTEVPDGLTVAIDRLREWIAFHPRNRLRDETMKILNLLKGSSAR